MVAVGEAGDVTGLVRHGAVPQAEVAASSCGVFNLAMSTATAGRLRRTGSKGRRRGNRWVRRLVVILGVLALVLVLLFFVGGGWYFSGLIYSDGLEVKQTSPEYEHQVVAVGAGTITLTDPEGEDSTLDGDDLWGVGWTRAAGSPAQVGFGQISGDGKGQEEVTRTFEVLTGEPPQTGDRIDLDGYAFPSDPAVALGRSVEEVFYAGPGGEFPAWYVPGEASTWAVLVHGKGADRTEMLRMMRSTVKAGLPSLAIGYRNDADAPRDVSGMYQFGTTEWRDLEAAVGYARDNGAGDVVLVGASMGGAVVASYLRNVPDAPVAAVVLDSPMLDFGETVSYGASQKELPIFGHVPEPLTWSAKRIATLRYGVDWGELDYLEDTSWLDVSALVVHGTADPRVPLSISQRLAQSRPEHVELLVVPDAVHVGAWNADPAGYDAELAEFLTRGNG